MKSLTYINDFALAELAPPQFYRSIEEIQSQGALPYIHHMRRGWEELGLSGIYCVDRRPTVYFKEAKHFTTEEIFSLHRSFWNQGTATLLVLIDEKEIRIYSSFVWPGKTATQEADSRLVEVLNRVDQALEIRHLLERVETGLIYNEKPDSFNRDNSVDRLLLANLKETRNLLNNTGLDLFTCHSLLGRIIFTGYLIDRNIINNEHLKKTGAMNADSLYDLFNNYDSMQAVAYLYKLFTNLQEVFNGSMFGENLSGELKHITEERAEILKRFLSGYLDGIFEGLFFHNVYDFRVIPTETISAIYEDFLKAEDNSEKINSGAYYTPRHLAEMVADQAVEGWETLLDKKVLDPSSGSGIFLVILFHRMAEEWRSRNPRARNTTKSRALLDILKNNLYGVDIKSTACRITSFSLYLAFLDQLEKTDIDDLQKDGKVLPPLLSLKKEKYPERKNFTIHEGNFFDEHLTIPDDFDLIIGNPPWTGRNQPEDPMAIAWYQSERNPYKEGIPKSKLNKVFMSENQIYQTFLWKSTLHLSNRGRAALLLSTKLIVNKTDEFQKHWFSRFTVETVVNLSDLRHMLFEHAVSPAVIMCYNRKEPTNHHKITYIVPKAMDGDPRRGSIQIFSEDIKQIDLKELLSFAKAGRAGSLWNRKFWGSLRDEEFLAQLEELPRLSDLVGKPDETKRWIKGQGFQPDTKSNSDKPKKPWWSKEYLFLEAKIISKGKINFILLESNCSPIGNRFPQLHRTRNPEIFSPPMVLVNQGYTKFVYVDFPVLFQHALQSISGPAEDANQLKFLTAVLHSKLAFYYQAHTSSNWWVEREKVHLHEVLQLPFPLPEDTQNPSRSAEIIHEVNQIIDDLKDSIADLDNNFAVFQTSREEMVHEASEKIEPLIYEYYDINPRERILIEDTYHLINESSQPKPFHTRRKIIPLQKRASSEDICAYAETLCSVLNLRTQNGLSVSADSTRSQGSGLSIVTLHKTKKSEPYVEKNASGELDAALARIQNNLNIKKGILAFIKGITVFEKELIHIIKPLSLRHWTRTAALNDADAVTSAIMNSVRRK